MGKTKIYWVERESDILGWNRVTGSMGNRSYACGWFHALTSLYTCPPTRMMGADSLDKEAEHSVVENHLGNATPSVASTLQRDHKPAAKIEPPPVVVTMLESLHKKVEELCKVNKNIQAIKLVRREVGLTLGQSKVVVDEVCAQLIAKQKKDDFLF